jgi:serine/threonine-protein kinase
MIHFSMLRPAREGEWDLKCPKCHTENPDTSRFCGSCAALLASQGQPPDSLTKTLQTPARIVSKDSLIAGKYRIIEEIGRGGMGVVYKAEDIKLQRMVALKFLPHPWISDPDARERFVQEARAASALDHPNICNIYEIGEAEDNRMHIAMAYYEGESLRERIKRGPLKQEEAMGIAVQAATGMAKAHQKGIVHRDLKPANLLITTDGVVKVVDFGLAKLAGQVKLTREGTTVGTVAYMSPEQAKGEAVDQRTDIWSLGVVLYEMLSGVLPFKGDFEQTLIHSILRQEPEPLAKLRKDMPPGLENIVYKALAKKPADRYQTMEELFEDLQSVAEGLKPIRAASIIFRGRVLGIKKAYAYPAMAGILILAVLAWLFVFPKRAQAFDTIAVLPIENMSGDATQDAFCYGVYQDLITHLSSIKAFKKVIDKNTMMTFKGTKKKSSEIARELRVSAIITASADRSGNIVRIRFDVIDGPNDRQIGGGKFDGEYRDILSLEGQAAVAIAQKIQVDLTPNESQTLLRKRPVNPEAYDVYQKGMFILGRINQATDISSDIEQSIKYFEQALKIDPNFALAYAGLGWAYDMSAISISPLVAWPKAKDAASKALSIDDSLAEAYAVMAEAAMYFEWDWKASETYWVKSLELNPNYAWANGGYASLLGCLGRHEEAISYAERALALDPNTQGTIGIGMQAYFSARQHDKSIALAREALKLFPGHPWLQLGIAWDHYFQGKGKEATAEIQEVIKSGLPADSPFLPSLFAMMGEKTKANQAINDLLVRLKGGYIDPLPLANAYALLGEYDHAFKWLEKCIEQRSIGMPYLKVNPFWDNLRADSRWPALLRRVGLEK